MQQKQTSQIKNKNKHNPKTKQLQKLIQNTIVELAN